MPNGHPNQLANLRQGGNGKPGGWPGSARPRNEVVELCKEGFAEAIPVLQKIAFDPNTRTKDRIDAINQLGRFGVGTIVVHELTNDQVLVVIAGIAAKYIPADQYEEFRAEVKTAIEQL